jgi:hypothetical protein
VRRAPSQSPISRIEGDGRIGSSAGPPPSILRPAAPSPPPKLFLISHNCRVPRMQIPRGDSHALSPSSSILRQKRAISITKSLLALALGSVAAASRWEPAVLTRTTKISCLRAQPRAFRRFPSPSPSPTPSRLCSPGRSFISLILASTNSMPKSKFEPRDSTLPGSSDPGRSDAVQDARAAYCGPSEGPFNGPACTSVAPPSHEIRNSRE